LPRILNFQKKFASRKIKTRTKKEMLKIKKCKKYLEKIIAF